MAKKSFNISSTLKKNKESLEPQLPKKVELKKKSRDFESVKDKVEDIHNKVEPTPQPPVQKQAEVTIPPATTVSSEQPAEIEGVPKAKETSQKESAPKLTTRKAKISITPKERMVRMTIDTPETMHRKLKIKSIEKGVSMRDYILRLIEREIKKG